MSQSDLLYVSQTLLASAFYYGVCGGISGYVLSSIASAAFRVVRRSIRGR